MDPEFLQALLHDLQGPVGRVRMLGELLARRNATGLDDESKLLISHIEKSASTADGILEALHRYAEIAELSFQRTRFDLTAAVQTAMSRLETQLERSGATVSYADLPEVVGDKA